MSLTIYSYPNNPRVYKALVAAKYVGVEINVPDFKFGEDNKNAEFLKKNPLGKVPVLDTPEGPIWESNAIARYVARKGNNLFGSNAYENALVDQWIDFAVGELELPARAWLYPIWGFIPNNVEITKKAMGDIRKGLDLLNKHFQTRTWLVGERVSLADIILVSTLYPLYTTVLDNGFRKAFTHVNRWFLTAVNQPNFKAVYGEVKLAEKMAQAPKAPAAEEAPKKEAPKKEAPKKKEEKKEEPAAANLEDEIEAAEKAEKKAPNPLDLLPPSKLDLDSWKRMYSNNDTRSVALPWFWENFDREGWSLWFADYKYNEELNQLFKTNNFVGGWLQRLDKLRKYGFGSVLIFGDEPALSISSAWLFRGQEVPKEMTDCDDYELYNWRKVDIDSTADKELLEDIWAWNGKFGNSGKVFNDQGKVFK